VETSCGVRGCGLSSRWCLGPGGGASCTQVHSPSSCLEWLVAPLPSLNFRVLMAAGFRLWNAAKSMGAFTFSLGSQELCASE
jgi:hypothetical protein